MDELQQHFFKRVCCGGKKSENFALCPYISGWHVAIKFSRHLTERKLGSLEISNTTMILFWVVGWILSISLLVMKWSKSNQMLQTIWHHSSVQFSLLFQMVHFFPLSPWGTTLRRLNFPLKSKKGRKGESLALLQIWHFYFRVLIRPF